ncbi:hypothetical protein [Devosia sp. DBB001]|nr:hypothetical protein [Devosia sp. DBB001]
MAGDLVRPKDLPPNSTINPNARIPADDGAKVYGPTLTEAVNQARPFASQAEAEAGVISTKAMSPLTTKQAIYALGDARYATAAQGAKADTAVQPGSLATVATTGAYADLTGKPTLGTAAAQDTTAFAPAAAAVPVGGTTGQVLAKASNTDRDLVWNSAGTGDVTGPGSSTDGAPTVFNGTTGKAIKVGAFASQSDAETGTDTAKFMNALRTAQAIAAIRPAGSLVQMVKSITVTATTISTVISLSDTIPTDSTGTQILAASITPKKVGNKIRGIVNIWGGASALINVTALVCVDNATNALTARAQTVGGAWADQMTFEFDYTIASLTSRTFAIRFGVNTGNFTLNGLSTGRLWGGIAQCSLVLEEIAS